MSDIHPLPVYPRKPIGDDLALFKQAKILLNTKQLIQPVDAVPGSPTRIIALREKLPWIADYAYVENPNVGNIAAAMEWALGMKEDSRATTVLRKLQEIMGEGVKEIGDTD